MIKSKVIDILKKLSKEEMKNFSDFTASPFFNKKTSPAKLLKIYVNFHPGFTDDNFTKEKVYKKIFGNKIYNDEVFRNLNSDLFILAENFLSQLNFEEDPFTMKKHLISELNKRKILNTFEKNYLEGNKILSNYEHRDSEFFYNSCFLMLAKDMHNSLKLEFNKEDVSEAQNDFIVFFIMKLLDMQNYNLYECRVNGLDNTMFLNSKSIEKIFAGIPDKIKQMPQIQIYYNALKLEETSDPKYFENLKRLLNKSGKLIEKKNHFNKYVDLIDFIKRTQTGDQFKKLSNLFELRKNIVEKNLFTENFIPNLFFLNVVNSALYLKKFQWVEKFIDKYNNLIYYKYRESTTELSYALLYFEKKDFEKSLSYVSKIKYEDSYYNLEVKNLTTRIYFELDQFDLLMSFIDSYRIYISKNRYLSSDSVKSHTYFINNLLKLIKIKEGKKSYKLKDLKSKVSKIDFVNMNWLLEKIEELN